MATKKSTQPAPAPSTTVHSPRQIKPVLSKPNATYLPSQDGSDVGKRLATLQACLAEVDEKIEMAYDAADNADPIEEVLHHLGHEILIDAIRPMMGEQPTRADAAAVFSALHLPVALIQAAISLAAGTVLHQTLVEAFDLLHWAHMELDCCGEFVKLLPEQEIAQESPPPAWEVANNKVNSQIGEICRLLGLAVDDAHGCATNAEKAVLDLGEMIVRMLSPVVDLLQAGPIDADKAEALFDLLSDPVQILEALVGITAGTRFESAMAEANRLILNASHALMDMDPWDQAPAQAPAAAAGAKSVAQGDDYEQRRGLAHDACHQIGELTDSVKALYEDSEEAPVMNGLMSRIHLLAEVVHFAARLHGNPDEEEFPTLDKLQRAFKGQLSW